LQVSTFVFDQKKLKEKLLKIIEKKEKTKAIFWILHLGSFERKRLIKKH